MPSKNRTNKRKIRKTRRRKQRGGMISTLVASKNTPHIRRSDGPILPEDILFQDHDVCILNPDVKKGVLIFTEYKQPADMPPLCEAGLKTGAQLNREGVYFGGIMIHDYIFFRAPYFSDAIDYTSIDTEIRSSFGATESVMPSRVWIRIDPDKSNVYSSEIRARFSSNFKSMSPENVSAMESEVIKSRKTMNDYLQILDTNKSEIQNTLPGEKLLYDLFTSKAVKRVPIAGMKKSYEDLAVSGEEESDYSSLYPLVSFNINRSSEVLVRVPHLTPNYFVKCS